MDKPTASIYQIKVTLRDIEPLIWRRLLISGETTLTKLHHIIQVVMGWEDCHLHLFIIHAEKYSAPIPYDPYHLKELGAKSTGRIKLNRLISAEGETFTYEYDFGDSWEHDVLVEKILPPDPMQKFPVCIEGKRACPPEDVGGVWSYAHFLEAIQDPDHEEHDFLLEWVGGKFNPDALDLEAVNQRLKSLR